ncbi:MAG: hypothetical protein CMH73_00090 [Nitrospina sp.]|jgi:hypothetical protein|nr:hypothetical protein [Nitrospina sp.]
MNTFKLISAFIMLFLLVSSSYSQVPVSAPNNSLINSSSFSVCIKPWRFNSPRFKHSIYKEKYNSNIIVDINLPLGPINDVVELPKNKSIENGSFCQQITLPYYENINKNSFLF